MPTAVIMPKFEMAQETGAILQWLKAEGDSVERGEPLLEVETDKVTMEVEAPASGTLVGIRAQAGAVVPVAQPIAYIVQPGEAWPEGAERAPAAPRAAATPLAERVARTHGVDLGTVAGSGPGGRITKEDVKAYVAGKRRQPAPVVDKVRTVPAARRVARELGIDLTSVSGTRPDGRAQSDDVRRATAEVSTSQPAVVGRPAIRRTIPLTGMRRTIAERMTASVREAPQFSAEVDVDMSRALAIIEDLRLDEEPSDGPRVTLTAFLVKACAWALERNPAINAALEDETIVEWAEVNIGVAVAVEDGLVVPVIRGADSLGIREIAGRLDDLAARAREGRLHPEDVQGGTFTLSNLGMFRIDRFTAILNPPQAAILAVGCVSKRPAVLEDDHVAARPMATLTLTADHRVVDGATAGRFLGDLRVAIERPGVLLP